MLHCTPTVDVGGIPVAPAVPQTKVPPGPAWGLYTAHAMSSLGPGSLAPVYRMLRASSTSWASYSGLVGRIRSICPLWVYKYTCRGGAEREEGGEGGRGRGAGGGRGRGREGQGEGGGGGGRGRGREFTVEHTALYGAQNACPGTVHVAAVWTSHRTPVSLQLQGECLPGALLFS